MSEVWKSWSSSLQSIRIKVTEQFSFTFLKDQIRRYAKLKNIKMNVNIGRLLTMSGT